jgi:hypothetical protein
MWKRWAILLLLGTSLTACAGTGPEEGTSAAIQPGDTAGPDLRGARPHGQMSVCSAAALTGLVGTWVRDDGATVTIDDDLVLNGDVELCSDADGRLEQTTRGPYPVSSGHSWHARPDLLATYAFHRDGEGTGTAGSWTAEGYAQDDESDLRWRETITFALDGTYQWSRATWGDDEDGTEGSQGTWTEQTTDGLGRLELSGARGVLFTDGDAVWTDDYYVRAE